MCNRNLVKDRLIELVSRTFHIPKDVLLEQNKSLLNVKLGLNAVALVYLYFLVQQEFGVVFSKHVLNQHRFDSVETITDIILVELEHNEKDLLHQSMQYEYNVK